MGRSIGLEWFLLITIAVAGAFLRIEASNHLTAISSDGVATRAGALVEPESVVYAYRVNDQASTIFAHKIGSETSISIGPRSGFSSPDEGTFRTFLQSILAYDNTQGV